MSTREHYGTLFPAAVVGSLPRPDFVREAVMGERAMDSGRLEQVMDAAVAGAKASVTVQNKGLAPLFYALVTSTFAGRFSRNLFTVPPRSSRAIDFFFEGLAPTSAVEFENSMHIDWMNRDPHARE